MIAAAILAGVAFALYCAMVYAERNRTRRAREARLQSIGR